MASNADAAPSAPGFAGPNTAGSVSFKAYLVQKRSDKPKEVRRFGMEQNEVTSFDLLKKKLRQVFPSLAGKEFSISWKDFEDDDIIISSNDELLTALTETTDQVRRLYLTIKDPITVSIQPPFEWKPIDVVLGGSCMDANDTIDSDEDDDDDDEEEDLLFTPPGCKRSWQSALRGPSVKTHPFVSCDGCNKNISGHRYKCMECDDFDLCPDCESQNMHKDHIMLRIPLTMSHYPKLNHFGKSMRYMSVALRKIENRIKKQERRMHKSADGSMTYGDFYSYARGAEIPNSKRCKRDDKEKDKKEKREKKDKKDKRDSKEPPCAGAQAPKPNESSPSSARGGCPFPAGILSSFLNPQAIGNLLSPQNLTSLQQLFEQMSPVPELLLQEVAQNLADVRLSDPAPATSEAATPPGNPFSVNAKKSAPTAEPDSAAPSSSSAPQTPATLRKEVLIKENENQDQSQAGAVRPEASLPGANASQADANIAGNSQPQSGRSSRSSSEEAEPEGWTVVDAQMREGSGDQPSVYPMLPQVDPTPEPVVLRPVTPPAPAPAAAAAASEETLQRPMHRDRDVRNCLRALAEMGYDARDPMIVDLAEEYKGSVTRVLNVLLS